MKYVLEMINTVYIWNNCKLNTPGAPGISSVGIYLYLQL